MSPSTSNAILPVSAPAGAAQIMSAARALKIPRPMGSSYPDQQVGDTLPRVVLGVLMLAAAAFFLHLTRGATFHLDEWQWLLDRRGKGAHTFLDPPNQHPSGVPGVVYQGFFATARARYFP